MFYPDYKSVEAIEQIDRYRRFWDHEPATYKGLTVVEITDAGAGTIKGLYIGENPAMSDPDQGQPAFCGSNICVQDPFLTETVLRRCDLLPAPFPRRTASPTPTDGFSVGVA